MKFYYEENGKVYLDLNEASPEWCNMDCPIIYVESNGKDGRWPGWRLSTGLTIEDGNSDLVQLFTSFVKKSSEAFYAKYPDCWKGRNGFWLNFVKDNREHHIEEAV
jgi:hypothetical protein